MTDGWWRREAQRPVQAVRSVSIQTQKHLPKDLAFGGALGEKLRAPYVHKRSLRDRTGAGLDITFCHLPFCSSRKRLYVLRVASWIAQGRRLARRFRWHLCQLEPNRSLRLVQLVQMEVGNAVHLKPNADKFANALQRQTSVRRILLRLTLQWQTSVGRISSLLRLTLLRQTSVRRISSLLQHIERVLGEASQLKSCSRSRWICRSSMSWTSG